ncbi:hypothetical protein [Aureimonas sp. SK2]|uniref:ribonuclease toxin HepT-like protein n=1 Tax=Aureimonas sp. SK2 TaxID=3015992 RepID=UPI0032616E4E
MVEFRSAVFAKLSMKVERADGELRNLTKHAFDRRLAIMSDDWEATTAASLGVHNIYNGIEDILKAVAKDVDGSVPTGGSEHQDILDQMAAPIPGLRPALLSADLYRNLTELKGFRHLVRHRYGIEMSGAKVLENVERMQRAFPSFVEALVDLERELTSDIGDADDLAN